MSDYIMDANAYGYGSKSWILRKAIEHAPVENKNLTLQSLVTLLESQQPVTINGLLDVITQGVLAGHYLPTAYPPKAKVEPVYDVSDAEQTGWNTPENESTGRDPLKKITPEEIDKFVADFDDLPDAEDPYEGWHMNEARDV